MQRRGRIVIGIIVAAVLVAIVAAVGPLLYRDLIAGEAAEAPTLRAEGSTLTVGSGAPLTAEDLTGTWELIEGSSAGYRVDEVLNGTDVTVTGRTDAVTGSLTVTELTLERAEFVVDVAAIATDNSARDAYFRDVVMRVAEYPTANFRLTEPVTAPTAPTSGETMTFEFSGDLTIAGVTQPVTFPAQMRTDGELVEIAGQVPIRFADFGVTAPSLGFVAVEERGLVEFQLVARRSG